MSIDNMLSVISSIGFPAAISVILLYFMNRWVNETVKTLEKLNIEIEEIQRMLEILITNKKFL